MIVNNFDASGVETGPAEADPPLVVDSNGMLSQSIAGEGLKMISRDCTKIGQSAGGMKLIEPPLRHLRNGLEPPAELATKNLLRLFVPERPDHEFRILPLCV
jgi:hypothetical protein